MEESGKNYRLMKRTDRMDLVLVVSRMLPSECEQFRKHCTSEPQNALMVDKQGLRTAPRLRSLEARRHHQRTIVLK